MNQLKVFSAFTGVGGLDLPFHKNNTFEVIGFSEVEKSCIDVLRYRYPHIPNYGDISKIDFDELPDIDVLVGGFPCQDISTQGKMAGFSGEKSVLFNYLLKILDAKKPRYFIFENVKALLSSAMGWEMAHITSSLSERGYDFKYEILDSSDFGTPQQRERVFFFGVKKEYSKFTGDTIYDFYWKNKIESLASQKAQCLDFEAYRCDKLGNVYGKLGQKLGQQKISKYESVHLRIGKKSYRKLTHRLIWEAFNGRIPDGMEINHKNHIPTDNRLSNLELVNSATNSQRYFQSLNKRFGVRLHKGSYQYRFISNREYYSKSGFQTADEAYVALFEHYFTVNGKKPWNNTKIISWSKSTRTHHIDFRIREDGLINTLTTGQGCNGFSTGNFVYDENSQSLRILTPSECEKLMLLPKNWTRFGVDDKDELYELSDSARYSMCGNAVVNECVTPLVQMIVDNEKRLIEKQINVLSLFDGMSCGRLALNKLGVAVDKYYASEIKPIAIKVTKFNFPDTIQLGDVNNWKSWDIDFSKIDLLIGGSPCKDLSVANKSRLGLDGEKSSLFYVYKEILDHVRTLNPKVKFLLENVRPPKEDGDKISEILNCQPIIINSSLVSAQLRERFYWTNIPVTGVLSDRGIKLQDIIDHGYTPRLKARCLLESDSEPLTTPHKMFHRYYNRFTTLIFKDEKHFNDCLKFYESNCLGKKANELNIKEPSVFSGVRYFNQQELERLQTVPQGYTFCVPRDEAASLLGDGWTVDVIEYLLSGLLAKN